MPRRKVEARHRRAEAANSGVPEEGPQIAPPPVEPPKPRKKISAEAREKIRKAKEDGKKAEAEPLREEGSTSEARGPYDPER